MKILFASLKNQVRVPPMARFADNLTSGVDGVESLVDAGAGLLINGRKIIPYAWVLEMDVHPDPPQGMKVGKR